MQTHRFRRDFQIPPARVRTHRPGRNQSFFLLASFNQAFSYLCVAPLFRAAVNRKTQARRRSRTSLKCGIRKQALGVRKKALYLVMCGFLLYCTVGEAEEDLQ